MDSYIQLLEISGKVFNCRDLSLVFQDGRTLQQCSAKLLTAVYEGVKSPSNASSLIINLTPASQQLACKLLDLAYDLGLEVCMINSVNHSAKLIKVNQNLFTHVYRVYSVFFACS